MENTPLFFADGESPKMIEAFKKAQETFKYFWREISWEYRRVVPALDVACVKLAFTQEIDNDTVVEHMWINDINFDGEKIKGTLVNDPDELTNVSNGDYVEIPVNQISDWLFASQDKTYGGFTIHAMRSEMSETEREEHDEAWGLNFGDFNDILVAYEQKEKPENLIEHPMSKNMKDSLVEFVKANPNELVAQDESGYTFLHREAIAGNSTIVKALIESGADVNAKTHNNKTAQDFAEQLKWQHLIEVF
ncbi:uncharacterized protein YegJ (DUF2314 family) [Flavobacterium araucananum]|uniref:DUF2314 domain-containing protein n=1 Tax=Flavobacterium araucananum TaxID=946678 RepID=A0A227NXB8_9FLAO|nr:DUF2314 domain-containing protein [Flavobacterium araucananum]OXG02289.1 hypothetical protein B0A64_18655 [Flavobacterium araucananum]PWJ98227.1 uncharacterized protein YegJ (DUF2314 family) [Flavobacterium araucananum]